MPEVDPKRIGTRVRAARVRAGFKSQAAFAEALGVSDETVGRVERGAFEPSLSTMVAIADVLRLPIDEIVGRQVPAPRDRDLARRLAQIVESLDDETRRNVFQIVERLARAMPRERGQPGIGRAAKRA